MINELKRIWLSVTGNYKFLPYSESMFVDQQEKAKQSRLLISFFYFFVFTTSIQTFSSFYQFPEWNTLLESKHLFIPVWSMKWLEYVKWSIGIKFILLFYFFSSLIGVFLWQNSRWVRGCVFLSVFLYVSLISSFGKIDHYMHIMIVVAFMLIFLPGMRNEENDADKEMLKVIFGIQCFILLTYFVSGFFKFYGILDQELTGSTSALTQEGLAQNVAKTNFASNSQSFFSSLILNTRSPIFPVILVTGYLLELFSILIIGRPQWHRVWGLLLVTFHAFILMTVGPDFTIQAMVVGIFILHSPFAKMSPWAIS